MQISTFDIVERLRESPFAIPHLSDFKLKKTGSISAEEILNNSHISLYSLEFDTKTAVLVETPAEIDMSQAPFMFTTQYDEALQVITMSFDDLLELAKEVNIDEERLIFIHSTGRCGSTLASQVFAQVPGVVNLSEPFFLPQIVIEKVTGSLQEDQLKALLRASILLLCKSDAETGWVIKEHSYAIELTQWMGKLFPQAKHLFLYRNAETWMRSCLSAYVGGGLLNDDELREQEGFFRAYKARLIPPLYQQADTPHLRFPELMSIEWLHTMTRHAEAVDLGMEMLAIRYKSWKTDPRKTAVAMLDYCNCRPDDLAAVYAVLEQDSQAGTVLAQDATRKKWELSESDQATLARYVSEHAFIQSVDYEAPFSLK